MVTEPLPKTVISCVFCAMRENRFLLFLNHLRLAYSNLKSFALILNIHSARHTFATIFLRKTKDLATLKEIMGHSEFKETLVYAHVIDDAKIEGVETAFNSFE